MRVGKPVPPGLIARESAQALLKSKECGAEAYGATPLVSPGDALLDAEGDAISSGANALATGERGTAITLAEHRCAVSTGDFSQAIAVKHGSSAVAAGALSHAATFMDGWAISGEGNAVCLGFGSAVSCGDGKAAVVCEGGQAYALGVEGRAFAASDHGQATASGKFGEAVALGENGRAACNGTRGLAIAAGRNGRAKGSLDSWLVLAHRDDLGRIVSVVSVKVDGKRIKPGTWYGLVDEKITISQDADKS